ncbi:hypothetical protein H2201_000188 [Coniosporium apollinis]|uniref:Uncharacterized protein n=1 Tax=Coniosporium apollinis TaxID=61459 RepID=A0ABQ9PBT5_9PEZI|nr:hypothetical protein H2201_000188 [Coniosporium apollinis]
MFLAYSLPDYIDKLNDEIRELPVNNPLDAWYEHPRKKFLQKGQIMEPLKRPSYQLPYAPTFVSEDKYVTIMGFSAVRETEP